MRTHCERNATLNLNLNLSKNLQKVFLRALPRQRNPIAKKCWKASQMADLVPNDIFDRLPERYQRRARDIATRVSELKLLLKRCDISAIVDAATRLQGQLRWQPETDHEAFGAEFRVACQDLPEWAVSEATNDFLAGRVTNHTGQFMPTCAEFARHARSVIHPFLTEMSILRREAEQLFERAEDERRRDQIAIERARPGHREWVRNLAKSITAGAPAISAHTHGAIDPAAQARLDAMKAQRHEPPSKLAQTNIVRGAKR
jgi:hypothetical protein